MTKHDYLADVDAVRRIEAVPKILEVVCRTTGMGFAAVARVTEDRWIACDVLDTIDFGLKPGGELKVDTTICHEIRQTREAVVINHVAEDDCYKGHHTPAMYGFQSYISMPIILSDGTLFGTLCAIDPRPARLKTPETIGMFKLFAELIAFHLQAADRLASSQEDLVDERATSELREQFIAVLGHDLRNPLAAVESGTRLLERTPLNEKAQTVLGLMKNAVHRMARLIDDVLDFARGRLGGGIDLHLTTESLKPALEQVVAEFQASQPDRVIDANLDVDMPITCDSQRIARLFSNLLGNALKHGDVASPVRVHASTHDKRFMLAVSNDGPVITPETMATLFKPFVRGDGRSKEQGLGLGLYISSQIAHAHHGTLSVVSTDKETCFTFDMPLI